MPSNIKAANTDLDDIFMLRVNAARTDVQYHVNGVDIANRYEAIGSGTPRTPDTNIHLNDQDLVQLFRDKNDLLYTVLWTSTAGTARKTKVAQAPGDVVLSWNTDLTMTINADASSNLNSPYASNGTGSNFEIRWVTVPPLSGTGAAVTPVSFTENQFLPCSSLRQLQFSGNQTQGGVERVVVVDVTVRVAGNSGTEVTKRITVTTQNVV